MRRLQTSAAARGAGRGANRHLAEQQENRLGFQTRKADVRRIREPLIGAAVDCCLIDAGQNFPLQTIASCRHARHSRQGRCRELGRSSHPDNPRNILRSPSLPVLLRPADDQRPDPKPAPKNSAPIPLGP